MTPPSDPKPSPRVKVPKALKRTRMRKALPKGRAGWVERRDAHLEAHPRCEFIVMHDAAPARTFPYSECWGPLTVHHIQPRQSGGTTEDTSPLATLCAGHHDYVEQHRDWARSVGLLLRPWARGVASSTTREQTQ